MAQEDEAPQQRSVRSGPLVTRRQFLGRSGAVALALGGGLAGCSRRGGRQGSGGQRDKGEVVVITWGGAEKARLADAFKEETGIRMRLVPGSDDADFYNKVKVGSGEQYDVVISNVGFVPLYERAGLIEVLDLKQFPAAHELYPEFRTDTRFEYLKGPDRSLVFPNQWGAYSLTYSTIVPSRPAEPVSWEELWRAPKGKVMLDGFYVTNIALAGRMSGVPWDGVFAMDGPALDEATQRLIDLKPFQLATAETVMVSAFRTRKATIGMLFSLGAATTINRKAGRDIARSVVPTEGVVGALDGQMLIKGARNRDNALEFINFLGGKRAQTIFWELYHGPTANRAATEAIIARGGPDGELMKAQRGDEPKIAAALVQLRQPDHPEAWNQAWDRVLAA
jgi:spermidine/putrescine transport system substrate-binding protein